MFLFISSINQNKILKSQCFDNKSIKLKIIEDNTFSSYTTYSNVGDKNN